MDSTIRKIAEAELPGLAAIWTSLLQESVSNEIFLSWEWVSAWWEAFKGPDRELYILVGTNAEGEIEGIAPFCLEKQSMFGIADWSTVKFCASTDTDSDHLDLVCPKGRYALFFESVIHYLEQHGNEWDRIDLAGIRSDSPMLIYVETLSRKYLVEVGEYNRCPYISTVGSFESFLETFPGKKRYNLLRSRKLLIKSKGCVYEVYDRPDDLKRMVDQLFNLHLDRAMRKDITSKLNDPRQKDFHKILMSLPGSEGKISLIFLRENESYMAACYFLIHDNKCSFYQSGLSPKGKKLGAGTVLLSVGIESAFERNLTEFDFLRGMEEYKSYWTKRSRGNFKMIIRKRDFTGWIGALSTRTRHCLSAMIARRRAAGVGGGERVNQKDPKGK